MRAHQIMTRPVITVTPETTIVEAANIMLQRHVSGLPVTDGAGKLVGHRLGGRFYPPQRNRHAAQARPLAEIHSRPEQSGNRFRS